MKTVGELMHGRPRVTLSASVSTLKAARIMAEREVGAVLVTDPNGTAIGIFTERDLMMRVVVAGRDPAKVTLEEVMTRDMFWTNSKQRLVDVEREMDERHVRHLPVIDEGQFLGMLSLRDLLREHVHETVDELHALQDYIRES